MSDKKKDYFVPEQLEDDDFEKEKIEAKRLKKEKKVKKTISDDEENSQVTIDKNKIKNIIFIILAIVLIGVGIYLYLNPIEKKASEPEQAAKDFCASINSKNWQEVNNLLDFKGYYTLGYVLQSESEFTKFDEAYKDVNNNDSSYAQFLQLVEILTHIDEDTLNGTADIKIRLNNIQSCNKIQDTDTLYRIIADFDYVIDGQAQSYSGAIYVSNASGEYKLVFGEWIQEVLNYYQSIYMLQSGYGY